MNTPPKKKWIKPELIVLGRENSGEKVLAFCNTTPNPISGLCTTDGTANAAGPS